MTLDNNHVISNIIENLTQRKEEMDKRKHYPILFINWVWQK
jgi:hypothetical protein